MLAPLEEYELLEEIACPAHARANKAVERFCDLRTDAAAREAIRMLLMPGAEVSLFDWLESRPVERVKRDVLKLLDTAILKSKRQGAA